MIGDKLDLSEQMPTPEADARIAFGERVAPAEKSPNATVIRNIELPPGELTEQSDIEVRRQIEVD